MTRPNKDRYFMDIAKAASKRSTCDRLQVGCVIVKDGEIVSTGYNGSISGMPHCDDVGHLEVDNHCVRTVHGEMNAILQAASKGRSIRDSWIYLNYFPCVNCLKHLVQVGVYVIIYEEEYKSSENWLTRHMEELGVFDEAIHFDGTGAWKSDRSTEYGDAQLPLVHIGKIGEDDSIQWRSFKSSQEEE